MNAAWLRYLSHPSTPDARPPIGELIAALDRPTVRGNPFHSIPADPPYSITDHVIGSGRRRRFASGSPA
jgi:hypothetical protein